MFVCVFTYICMFSLTKGKHQVCKIDCHSEIKKHQNIQGINRKYEELWWELMWGGVHRSKAQINISCVRKKAPLATGGLFAVVRLSRSAERSSSSVALWSPPPHPSAFDSWDKKETRGSSETSHKKTPKAQSAEESGARQPEEAAWLLFQWALWPREETRTAFQAE